MNDKVIKRNKTNVVTKTVKVANNAKMDKSIQTKTLDALKKADKPVKATRKPKVDKPIQAETAATPQITMKREKVEKPKKVILAAKEKGPKKARISKGLATHNRRVKQEKRNPNPVHK